MGGILRDKKKEGKKSPLVSALQNHHPEPSCHPTWIKVPSVLVAVGLRARRLTLGLRCGRGQRGGAEGGGIRRPRDLNKTKVTELPEPWRSHFVLRVDFIQEPTAEDPPPPPWILPLPRHVERQTEIIHGAMCRLSLTPGW